MSAELGQGLVVIQILGRHTVYKNSFLKFGVDQLTWGEVMMKINGKRAQVKDKEILLKEVRDLPPTLIPEQL